MEASALRAPAGLTRLSLPAALLKLRSDEQLVALFRAGNDDAFGVIHDRYRQRLFAYVRQMLAGSRSDAEDALQDVFLRAYNALRADERPVALKAWLYRVAHNRCIDQLRRPVPAPADVFDLNHPAAPDPLAETERRDDLRRLVADVQRLPEQQRSALLMRELEGLTYADLAAALDVSVPAVKSLLVRARIGLVEAAEARDTACTEIQSDLALSFGKGVRASARARRHMRECDGCRAYRMQLRTVHSELGALLPGPGPLTLLAKLFGLGAGAGGGGAAVVGGGATAGVTAKVAAIVCCAAVVGGGAAELRSRTGGPPLPPANDPPAAGAKRSAEIAPERVVAPAPVAPPRAAPALRLRAESARPKAASKAAAARLGRSRAAGAAAAYDDPISPHYPTAEERAARAAPSTGGSAAPAAEDEPAATPQQSPSTSGGTGATATGASVTAAVASPTTAGTSGGTGSGSGSPTATTASTSSSTDSGSQGSTTTTTQSGTGDGGR